MGAIAFSDTFDLLMCEDSCIFTPLHIWTSLVAKLVKNPPAVWETWIQSLGWKDSLEKGKATHSSILAWRVPGTGESGGLPSMGSHRVGHD